VVEVKFTVQTGKLVVSVEADNRRDAIRNFFKLLKVLWPEWRSKIAQIALLHDRDETVPFRLIPSLWNMGLIDEDTALLNLMLTVGGNLKDARALLHFAARQDRWMTE